MPADLVILFTRLPQAGKAKTRLIPALGAAGAAALQRRLTEHCLQQVRNAAWDVLIAYTHDRPDAGAAMAAWLGSEHAYVPQAHGDLGAKLQAGIALGIARGYERIAVIGSDCPALGCQHIATAFSALEDHDLALGPATDGGYYLLAQRTLHPLLFTAMPWGGEVVAAQTRARAASQHLSMHELEPLVDIDCPQDLVHCAPWPQLATALPVDCQ